jgi:small subunit ribosomal protein S13
MAKNPHQHEEQSEVLVRIAGQDVKGSRGIYVGITKIKGVSWAVANAVCHNLKIDRKRKVSEFSKEEIMKIEQGLKNLKVPDYMKNRRKEPSVGETRHLLGVDLDMAKEFDIKRMKQIKSYKGNRHTFKLPVRGQRTRSHFRTGSAMGVKKPKVGKKS